MPVVTRKRTCVNTVSITNISIATNFSALQFFYSLVEIFVLPLLPNYCSNVAEIVIENECL
jgi:hypothetical protein